MRVAESMSQDFEIGTVVRLRSGSPAMTVVNPFGAEEKIETCWFHDGELRRGLFLAETLTNGNIRSDRSDNQR